MLGRGATIFLGLTAALSIWAIVLYFWDINLAQLSRSEFEAISWGGAAARNWLADPVQTCNSELFNGTTSAGSSCGHAEYGGHDKDRR